MTNLFKRQRDTPLFLWPGVKIEDDCLLLLFPPVVCSVHQDKILSSNKTWLPTSPPSALTYSSPPKNLAPLLPNLLSQHSFLINWNLNLGFVAFFETESFPHTSIHKIRTCHHFNLHDHHLGLLPCSNILEQICSIWYLANFMLDKPRHKLPGCSPSSRRLSLRKQSPQAPPPHCTLDKLTLLFGSPEDSLYVNTHLRTVCTRTQPEPEALRTTVLGSLFNRSLWI